MRRQTVLSGEISVLKKWPCSKAE